MAKYMSSKDRCTQVIFAERLKKTTGEDLLGRLTDYRSVRAANPTPFLWIEISGNPAGIANDHRIRRKAPRNQRICRDDAVMSNHQFAFIAHDGCPLANPASMLDPDFPSAGNSL